jgi:hypothetical protein
MKTKDYSDLIAQYTEALVGYHEIEFKYNNHEYGMERESDGQYGVWEFEPGAATGTKIATVKTPEEIFTIKCFGGKTILEIDDDVTDAIVF